MFSATQHTPKPHCNSNYDLPKDQLVRVQKSMKSWLLFLYVVSKSVTLYSRSAGGARSSECVSVTHCRLIWNTTLCSIVCKTLLACYLFSPSVWGIDKICCLFVCFFVNLFVQRVIWCFCLSTESHCFLLLIVFTIIMIK